MEGSAPVDDVITAPATLSLRKPTLSRLVAEQHSTRNSSLPSDSDVRRLPGSAATSLGSCGGVEPWRQAFAKHQPSITAATVQQH